MGEVSVLWDHPSRSVPPPLHWLDHGEKAGQAFLCNHQLCPQPCHRVKLCKVFTLAGACTWPPDRVQRNYLVPEEIQCILAKGSPPNKEPKSERGAGVQPQALAWLSVYRPEWCLQGSLHLHKHALSAFCVHKGGWRQTHYGKAHPERMTPVVTSNPYTNSLLRRLFHFESILISLRHWCCSAWHWGQTALKGACGKSTDVYPHRLLLARLLGCRGAVASFVLRTRLFLSSSLGFF